MNKWKQFKLNEYLIKYILNLIFRQEILVESCKYKVNESKIDITLHKTSNLKWVSLEAPRRKGL